MSLSPFTAQNSIRTRCAPLELQAQRVRSVSAPQGIPRYWDGQSLGRGSGLKARNGPVTRRGPQRSRKRVRPRRRRDPVPHWSRARRDCRRPRLVLDGSSARSRPTAASRSSARRSPGRRCCRSWARRTRTSSCSTCGCRTWTARLPRQLGRRHPDVKVVMLSASANPELVESALRRGAAAYVIKTVNPTISPRPYARRSRGTSIRRSAARNRARECESPRADRARAHDPRRACSRPLQRRDREGVLGRAPDGEVPPHQHLPQARRQEPHRGDAHRVSERACGEPDLRRRIGMTSTVSPVGSEPSGHDSVSEPSLSPYRYEGAAPADRRRGVHPRRPPRRFRPHLPPDLPARARRQRQLAQPRRGTRGDRERAADARRAHRLRPRRDVDRPAVARAGAHVRRLQPRRLRASVDRHVRSVVGAFSIARQPHARSAPERARSG